MPDSITLTRRAHEPDLYVEGDTGRIFVIEKPTDLVDDSGNVVGQEGQKHRRPIEPDADESGESETVRTIAERVRTPEALARFEAARQ